MDLPGLFDERKATNNYKHNDLALVNSFSSEYFQIFTTFNVNYIMRREKLDKKIILVIKYSDAELWKYFKTQIETMFINVANNKLEDFSKYSFIFTGYPEGVATFEMLSKILKNIAKNCD